MKIVILLHLKITVTLYIQLKEVIVTLS